MPKTAVNARLAERAAQLGTESLALDDSTHCISKIDNHATEPATGTVRDAVIDENVDWSGSR